MSETQTAPDSAPASDQINTNVGIEGGDPPKSGLEELQDELEAEGNLVDRVDNDESAPEEPENPDEADDSELIPLKINGKTVHKPLSEVIKDAQMYGATQIKLETAKKEAESAKRLQSELTTQQDAIKSLLGIMAKGDVATLAEFVSERLGGGEQFNRACVQYALHLYQQAKMSPQEREAVENKKLVEKYRREAEERQRADQERSMEYEINRWSEHLNVEVPKALAQVGLPDSEFVRSHIIATWRAAIERGQNPTATAVANYVKEQLEQANVGFGTQAKPVQQRPRATPQAVAKRNGSAVMPEQQGYQSWDQWLRTRGR